MTCAPPPGRMPTRNPRIRWRTAGNTVVALDPKSGGARRPASGPRVVTPTGFEPVFQA